MKEIALPPSVKRSVWRGGLTSYTLSNKHGTAVVTNHGAHVVSWKPKDYDEVFWVSPTTQTEIGQPIRGGIPICAPWFGKGPSGNREPMHGTVRLEEWSLVDAREPEPGFTEVSMIFQNPGKKFGPNPQPFSIIYSIAIGPGQMMIQTNVCNTGAGPFTYELMLHSYFAVSNTAYTSVTGLDGREWVDKSDVSTSDKPNTQDGMITFGDQETSMMFNGNPNCTLNDLPENRKVSVQTLGDNNRLIWTPGPDKANRLFGFDAKQYNKTVCIETGNVGDNAITLQPNHHHKTKTVYTVGHL